MLERRRVEIDTRYRNLNLFCEERQLNYRLAWDIEHGARANYRRVTLLALEAAYDLPAGQITRSLERFQLAAAAGEGLRESSDEDRGNGRASLR
ncbi:MAG: hypothetical protein J2P30_06655 [Actinobacteria bacterium]|nr:hypothetical protein [Actinomycetota bacterium]